MPEEKTNTMTPRTIRRIGWLAFALMWIPFAGLFVGTLGLPDGSYSWAELPALTRASLLETGVLFVLSRGAHIGAPLARWLRNRRIGATGERAEAKVLDTWDTGTTINEQPFVGLRLMVHPISGPPFEAETEEQVPRPKLAEVQPGSRLSVRFDTQIRAVALQGLESRVPQRWGERLQEGSLVATPAVTTGGR